MKIKSSNRNLLILILVIFGLLIVSVFFVIRQSRTKLAKEGINTLSIKALNKFEGFNQPIIKLMSALQDWGSNDIINLAEPEMLNAQLKPLIKVLNTVSGLIIADEFGNSFYIQPAEQGLMYRYSIDNGASYMVHIVDSIGSVIQKRKDTIKYNPLNQDWFIENINKEASDSVTWSQPYIFFTTSEWGRSGTVNWTNSNDVSFVAAIDVLLKQIFVTISGLADNGESKIFLFNELKQIFSPDVPPEFLINAEEFDDPIYSKSLENWNETTSNEPYSFFINNSRYWIKTQRINSLRNNFWLATISSEKNFLSVLGSQILIVGGLTLVLVLIGFVGAWWILRNSRTSDQVGDKLDIADFENSLKSLLTMGEGPELEFKSTVRMNLHSGQPGKEIELAWLKSIVAFLNTKGGILFIGVDDGGNIIGLEADRFPNTDKCLLHVKNLIRQHIGSDLFTFIDYDLKIVDSKQVIYFIVKQADIPAYLMDKNNDEVFYIRSGPSSEKLSVSKAVEYLKRRK